MKYILLLILVAIFATSCADDSWKAELEAIKTELTNQKALIEALQNNASITGIEQGNDSYTIHFSDGQSITLTNGKTPIITIGENGNWFINGEDTGKPSQGENGENGTDGADGTNGVDGQTPTIEIGSNGNWYINGTDTGVKAEGIDGSNTPSIINIINDGQSLTFVFSDGTQLKCPLQVISNFSGLTFWTIFDSFGEGNTWQKKYVELTGSIFYPDLNSSSPYPISIGGTSTNASALNGTLGRAKVLVSYKNKYPIDVVFIENVNDIGNELGNIDDMPWMQGDKIVCHEGPMNSYNEAVNYLSSDIGTILNETPTEKRKKGCMLTVPYYTNNEGINVRILTDASIDGEIYLYIGTKKHVVTITKSMDSKMITELLSSIFYPGGWSVINNGDSSITFTYYKTNTIEFNFDGNGTGVIASITNSRSTDEYIYYYTGYSSDEWTDRTKWVTNISLFSAYKGLIEYLQTNLPNAKLFWFIPSYWSVDFDDSSIKNSDGSFNLSLYQQKSVHKNWIKLMECQKSVSELYGIQVADIHNNCGISLNNITSFYNSKNVHPKIEGYYRWAETLFSLIN